MSTGRDFTIRAATEEDDTAIVELLCQSLGWENDDRHRALFTWKHRTNPVGPSPGWVAVDDQGVIGFRTFMHWGFRLGSDRVTAVRAVDTATHPRARGRGIFRTLTMHAIAEMSAGGVGWVFNTPNDQSAPGYLSMGWRRVGHLRVALRPAGIRVLPKMVASRQPGDLWSVSTTVAEDAMAVLGETETLAGLIGQGPSTGRVRTDRSPEYLKWRYGSSPVGYRALLAGKSVEDGLIFFRLRRRGAATEAVIADVLMPSGAVEPSGRLYQQILTASGADYLVAIGSHRPKTWLPLPGRGPLLTWRALSAEGDPPPIDRWDLTAGDVELF